ncbi:MAG: ATP-binding protein [Lachnospiraceae bacterium]|nr:ATP-binding protein [Lachnospiraceae bacterium]
MNPINIYTLTRINDSDGMQRLERQMSKRKGHLKIKEWEIEGLRILCDKLCDTDKESSSYDFFYSFTMPKLGKEFDLLRINEDYVVNIELKSGNVSDEVVKQQLKQNRYYLSSLERSIYSYTYISKDDRLVRLSGGGRLIDTDTEELFAVLKRQKFCYKGDIEELFKEDRFLISPLTDPGRFLRRDYFLTSSQRDIRKQILRDVLKKPGTVRRKYSIHGFTGLPGTGKTILLYDIAMQLSVSEKVCVLHLGSYEEELEQLNERLKRVDFYHCEPKERIKLKEDYAAILVDEGHRLNSTELEDIITIAKNKSIPVIIAYDKEDTIAFLERSTEGAVFIEQAEDFIGYKLTNRIRLNSELSSFISCLMCVARAGRKYDYPSVSLAFAGDMREADILIGNFEKDGYIYIWDNDIIDIYDDIVAQSYSKESRIEAKAATCKEFDKIVMMIDDSFFYDEEGYLRDIRLPDPERESVVRKLFHGLNRAKRSIAVVVKGNESVFYRILGVLQKKGQVR